MTDPNPDDEMRCQERRSAVLVVAYDEKSRAAIAESAVSYGVDSVPCASFADAEQQAIERDFRGVLVDLTAMIKAKDNEKLIAHTLTSLFPTLRVKCMGTMLIPMILSGDAKQDKSVKDFFVKTCAEFAPRRLRSGRRREICVPLLIGDERSFTANVSWTGAFLVVMHPERYRVGDCLKLSLMTGDEAGLEVEAKVVRTEPFGTRRPPGLGVQFQTVSERFEGFLSALLGSERGKDRDRLQR